MTDDSSSVSAERTVGFVGLGAMGAHMAARLLDAGHALAVFDTRAEALEPRNVMNSAGRRSSKVSR